MVKPDDSLAPLSRHFSEGWHAQALALADTMVTSGKFTVYGWANALSRALKAAEDAGSPDTEDTYYTAVVTALERLSAPQAGLSAIKIFARKEAWKKAYLSTPHGAPVELPRQD